MAKTGSIVEVTGYVHADSKQSGNGPVVVTLKTGGGKKKGKEGEYWPTNWIHCKFWDKGLQLSKGDLVVAAGGEIKTNEWEKDGVKQSRTEVHFREDAEVEVNGVAWRVASKGAVNTFSRPESTITDDDIPF